MTAFSGDPLLPRFSEQTDRLLESVALLDDAAAHAPSALPGWTRGHVLSHVARNADGLANLLRTATTGVQTPMYASKEHRERDIEAGADRAVALLQADIESSAERLLALLGDLPASALDVEVPNGLGARVPIAAVPWIRTREVAYHHIDLGTGFGFEQLPDDVLRRGPLECPPRLAAAAPGAQVTGVLADGSQLDLTVGDGDVPVRGDAADVLAWLTGRSAGRALYVTDGQPLPSLPGWG